MKREEKGFEFVIKKSRGVTLVALAVTIVVMLILAGIGYGTFYGKNGIIDQGEKIQNDIDISMKEEQEKINSLIEQNAKERAIKVIVTPETARNTEKVGTQNGVETGPIRVIIAYGEVDYANVDKYQYKFGETGTWQVAKENRIDFTNITKNTILEVRYVYYSGSTLKQEKYARYTIGNVDNTVPQVLAINAKTTTNKITLQANAEDKADTGAVSTTAGILRYEYNVNGGAYQTSSTFTNLTKNTEYTFNVKAIDKAGNETIVTKKVKTKDIPSNITFSSNPSVATKENVVVTITYPSEATSLELIKKYSLDKKTWQTYTTPVTMTDNGTIYAKLVDSTNQEGATVEYKVTNIDRQAPTIPVITNSSNGEWTNQNVIVVSKSTDVESGVLKMQYSKNGNTWIDYSTSCVNIGNNTWQLTDTWSAERNNTIYIRAVDNAGNIGGAATTLVKIDKTAPTVTFGTNGNSTNALTGSTTINVTDTSSLTTLRARWMQGTTALTQLSDFTGAGGWAFTNGSVSQQNPGATGDWYLWVYAEDSAGNYKIAHTNVFKIDTTGPTFTSVEIKNLSTTGYDVYVYGVKDTGAGIDRVQFPTWTEANGQDDLQTNWETSVAAKGVKQVDGTTWVYRVNVTAHKNEYGLYNTHIYMYDILGNVSNATIQTPTVPAVKVTYDNNYLSENLWTDTDDLGRYYSAATSPSAKINTKDTSVTNGYAVELTMNAGTGGGPYYAPPAALTSGTTYTWSIYVKASSNKTLTIGQEQAGTKVVNVTTSWQKITHTFTANSYQYIAFVFYLASGSTWTAGDKIYVHSLEIKQGNYTDSSTVDKGYASQLGTLGSPTRTGYTFAGWFTAPTGGTQISNATTTPASNTSYYAHWTINSYTVYYNGGTVQTQTKMYNEKLGTLPTVSYAGYTFDGWFTQMSGGTKVTSEMRVTNNVSYYAMSSKTVTATRRWWANGTEYYYGTAYIDYTGTQINAQIDIGGSYTPSGWTFRGYSTDSAGNAGINISGNVVSTSSDITVYASYSKTVTVTKRWWLNGTKTYTGTAYLDFAGNTINAAINVGSSYTPSDWVFRGYSTSDAGNATITVGDTTVYAISDTTVYASYIDSVIITIFPNGGEGNSTTLMGAKYLSYTNAVIGASLTMPTSGFTKPGYTLSGFSTNSSALFYTYKAGNTYTFTEITTLYATYYSEKQRFLDDLYLRAFNRGIDDVGKNTWMNVLNSNTKDNGIIHVMKGIIRSNEARGLKSDDNNFATGIYYYSDINSFVQYCYKIILGRDADAGGLANWALPLTNGGTKIYLSAMMNAGDTKFTTCIGVEDPNNAIETVLNGMCSSGEAANFRNRYSW